jgi:uncharacterized protein (UPF0335 family)
MPDKNYGDGGTFTGFSLDPARLGRHAMAPQGIKGGNMSDIDMTARAQIKAIVERIERLEEEKKALADDIRDVYLEAKGNGYDTKVLRKVISLRKQDAEKRAEEEAVLDTYLAALGMLGDGLTRVAGDN